MQTLDNVTDQSSLVVQVDFTDEVGDPVNPGSASWTLTDGNNAVVNSRLNVEITDPTSTVYITLDEDDLAADSKNQRILIVTGTYISSLTGTLLQTRQAATFTIENFPEVATLT